MKLARQGHCCLSAFLSLLFLFLFLFSSALHHPCLRSAGLSNLATIDIIIPAINQYVSHYRGTRITINESRPTTNQLRVYEPLTCRLLSTRVSYATRTALHCSIASQFRSVQASCLRQCRVLTATTPSFFSPRSLNRTGKEVTTVMSERMPFRFRACSQIPVMCSTPDRF